MKIHQLVQERRVGPLLAEANAGDRVILVHCGYSGRWTFAYGHLIMKTTKTRIHVGPTDTPYYRKTGLEVRRNHSQDRGGISHSFAILDDAETRKSIEAYVEEQSRKKQKALELRVAYRRVRHHAVWRKLYSEQLERLAVILDEMEEANAQDGDKDA